MDWGAGAGRAHTVREPPPQFIALLQKTGVVRDAAKTLMAAEQTREEAGTLKPAFNAVPTFNTLKGVDEQILMTLPTWFSASPRWGTKSPHHVRFHLLRGLSKRLPFGWSERTSNPNGWCIYQCAALTLTPRLPSRNRSPPCSRVVGYCLVSHYFNLWLTYRRDASFGRAI